jgi:hypothetical protein
VRAPHLLLVAVLAAACGHATPPHAASPTATSAEPASAFALAPADLDKLLEAQWAKAGVTPAPRADDRTWLRRLWVDVLGTLPPPETVKRFAADAAPDKRTKMVDEVLASPQWARHWTDYWDDELMGTARGGDIDRAAFRAWLRARLQANVGWNEIVLGLVTATGRQSGGGPRVAEKPEESGVNGAVNWTLRFESPNDLAGTASRTFLGVQIQCAQCHDHKTEKWKQDDFRRFASCFARVKPDVIDKGPTMGVKRVELVDTPRLPPRVTKNPELAPLAGVSPTTLDGKDLSKSEDVRKAIGAWMTSRDNPWFAKETVNRLWAHFLGRGFVNPVDDLRPGNPAIATEVWDALARDLVEHAFDTKRLMRTIALSEAYALGASSPLASSLAADKGAEIPLWSRFRVTPLAPIDLVGAIFAATDVDEEAAATGKVDPEQMRLQLLALYSFVFDTDEQTDKPAFEGTITQALTTLNGRLTTAGAAALPGSMLWRRVGMGSSDEAIIEEMFLRALSRPPTPAELGRFVQYVADQKVLPPPPRETISPPPPRRMDKPQKGGDKRPDPLARALQIKPQDARVAALEDVYWSLLNSSEFFFNH